MPSEPVELMTSTQKMAALWSHGAPLAMELADNPVGALVLGMLPAMLGSDDVASLIDSIDPDTADAGFAVVIDFLGRLRSDGAPDLVTGRHGAYVLDPRGDALVGGAVAESDEWRQVAALPVVADWLDQVRGPDLRDGGDGLG